MIYTRFQSRFGTTLAAVSDDKLCHLWLEGQKHAPDTAGWMIDDQHPIFSELKEQLAGYAEQSLKEFDLPIALKGTEFQKSVWQALQSIPYGQSLSYRELAQKLGKPKAVRAVAAAVGRNPLLIVIPCHRVVGVDGRLTGFAAGLDMKVELLGLEGVEF